MTLRLEIAALALVGSGLAASAKPLSLPFDFSYGEIGVTVSVRGTALHMIIDTGVDPSVIDIARADALGLKVDRDAGGEASGVGDDKHSKAYPTAIAGLVIGGRAFADVDALAFDMTAISGKAKHPLDGVLGYSFLTDKIILIDYPARTVGLLDQPSNATSAIRACKAHWSTPLASFKDETIPLIQDFRFGEATAPISLDTGSNGGISLYQSALDLPGMRSGLMLTGEKVYVGARGQGHAKTYVLNEPVGFGPFTLAPGEAVAVYPSPGSKDTRLANIGNALFARMKLKVLLNYRSRLITFYGDCG